jgi:hypothetical protein
MKFSVVLSFLAIFEFDASISQSQVSPRFGSEPLGVLNGSFDLNQGVPGLPRTHSPCRVEGALLKQ